MRRGQGVRDEYLILNGLSHAAVVSKSSTATFLNIVVLFPDVPWHRLHHCPYLSRLY